MSDEFVDIESKDQLKEVLGRTTICILVCTVDGRDGLNFSAQEELDTCIETKSRDYRTFARINGTEHKAELKEFGVDMGDEPFPKFVIFANGKPRIVEDTANVGLADLVGEYGQE